MHVIIITAIIIIFLTLARLYKGDSEVPCRLGKSHHISGSSSRIELTMETRIPQAQQRISYRNGLLLSTSTCQDIPVQYHHHCRRFTLKYCSTAQNTEFVSRFISLFHFFSSSCSLVKQRKENNELGVIAASMGGSYAKHLKQRKDFSLE